MLPPAGSSNKGTGPGSKPANDQQRSNLAAPQLSSSAAPSIKDDAAAPSKEPSAPVKPLAVSPSLQGSSGGGAARAIQQEDSTLGAKILWKRILKDLSSLPRAIGLMAAVFAFSAIGTFVPQNKVGGTGVPDLSAHSIHKHTVHLGLPGVSTHSHRPVKIIMLC